MGRKTTTVKREIIADQRYGNVLVSRFINNLTMRGKRSLAEGILYDALDMIQTKIPDQDPFQVFKAAVENVKPLLEVKSRRVGGANYQVPVEVRAERRQALAIKWIITAARDRAERTMKERLASELLDAFNKTGVAMKKREDTHKMAEANKAFAHYRW
ncbi:MAG: 30S ribosomal protein S7 [bacterium]